MFFDMMYASKLYPGYNEIFSIRPTQIDVDDHLRHDLTPSERNCRFHDEMPNNMTLFKNYSMAGCQFECMLSIRQVFNLLSKTEQLRFFKKIGSFLHLGIMILKSNQGDTQ